MRIVKHVKAMGAKIFGKLKKAGSQAETDSWMPSIIVLNKHGKPVRVPLASLARSPSVKKTKMFTGTVVLNGKK